MLYIGCHLSSSRGLAAMGRQALDPGGKYLSVLYPQPPGQPCQTSGRSGRRRPDGTAAKSRLCPHHRPRAVHVESVCRRGGSPHLCLGNAGDDLSRMEHLPGQLYNLHPGSHVGQGPEAGAAWIAQALNAVLRPEQTTTVLLETMAGKGSEVGGRFEELKAILDQVELREKVGVCLDTCHVWDAGYDLAGNLDGVLEEFDRVIGLDRLRAIHLNDSCNPLGSRKDPACRIGEGAIGTQALARVVRHPALRHLPFCLETPNELPGYAQEIALLRRLAEETV